MASCAWLRRTLNELGGFFDKLEALADTHSLKVIISTSGPSDEPARIPQEIHHLAGRRQRTQPRRRDIPRAMARPSGAMALLTQGTPPAAQNKRGVVICDICPPGTPPRPSAPPRPSCPAFPRKAACSFRRAFRPSAGGDPAPFHASLPGPAERILSAYLSDFTAEELHDCAAGGLRARPLRRRARAAEGRGRSARAGAVARPHPCL